jgi:glycosyltransferase involved in cell wall biosynthesis
VSGLRVALVAPSPGSGIGDYARALAAALRPLCELLVHSPAPLAGEAPLDALDPARHDHVWWQLGNERGQAPLAAGLERHGGVLTLHDWVLFDLACARWPELARGGAAAVWRAWREGGAEAARVVLDHARARRDWKLHPPACAEDADIWLDGWHEPEVGGRWSGRVARLRVGSRGRGGPASVLVALHAPRGRRIRLVARDMDEARVQGDDARHELELAVRLPCTLEFSATGSRLLAGQAACGDARDLGAHIVGVEVRDASGARQVDWTRPSRHPAPPALSTRRFELALNRSALRAARACFVHSEELATRVRAARGGLPVHVVEHGAAEEPAGIDRADAQRLLGITPGKFIVASFGGVQAHKRIAVLVEACARARRERPTLELLLAGAPDPELDLDALLARHGERDMVHRLGRVEEERIPLVLAASDLCVQLRGPSTGGTSGGVHRALAARRAVVASDLAEQRELPDECVLKLPQDADEVDRLARWLVRAHDEPERLRAMERAAGEHVRARAAWSVVARRQVELLEATPPTTR